MTSVVDQIREAYDTVRYFGGAFAESHPLNLNRVATLLGLSPAPMASCRILEIGCAEGLNLLPMAQVLPQSRMLGLDLSSRNIEIAEEMRRGLGLTNIEFRCQDIMEFDWEQGPFDYIIAHGFYSWVPSHVRDRLMQIMGRALAPQGVGYISYNTLPGWHLKRVSRDLMLFHSRSTKSPGERLAKGLEIFPFVSQNLPASLGYREVMKAAADTIPKSPNILHDEMGVVNDPVYFEQFVKHAEQHQLKYLGHASLSSGIPSLPAEIQKQIRALSADEITQEQYADFLGGRAFRVSLVCRADAKLSARRGKAVVAEMHVAGWLKEEKLPSDASGPWQFTVQKDKRTFVIHDSLMCDALRKISGAWPRSLPVGELITAALAEASNKIATGSFADLICESFYNMFLLELLELNTIPIDFIGGPSSRLCSTDLARLQAQRGMSITNLRHDGIPHNAVLGRLLPLLDGTKGRSSLLGEFTRMVHLQQISITSQSGKGIDADINVAFEQLLNYIADNSLILPG